MLAAGPNETDTTGSSESDPEFESHEPTTEMEEKLLEAVKKPPKKEKDI
jgi:hypothetical protein